MATFEFTLRGDQIGTFSSMSGTGNGVERVVTLQNVTALGSSSEIFTIRVDQVNPSDTEFHNGQLITILDSLGNVVMATTGVQPDIEQGLGGGDEHLILQSTGFLIDVGGLNPGPEQVQYGFADETATAEYGDNDGELDFADTRSDFPCFAEGTMIRTPGGDQTVQTLKDGDFVSTMDAGAQPILWIRSYCVRFESRTDPRKPVLIRAHALGADRPNQDLIVSGQHRVFFGAQDFHPSGVRQDRLLPAKGLTKLNGIRPMRGIRSVTYFSLLLPTHQLIWANKCPCESFYPGNYILRALQKTLRDELLQILPLLRLGDEIGYGPPIRPVATVGEAKSLVRLSRFHRPTRAYAVS